MNKTFSTTLLPKVFGITGLLCLSLHSPAQLPAFSWGNSFGSTGADLGIRMATDAAGNTYTTGSFTGTIDFDPGAGTLNLTSAGGTDIYVLKLDAAGNTVWAVNLGGTDDDVAQSIAVDASGNVYLSGSFKSTADFDPSGASFNLTSNGGGDAFVCKLNAAGGLAWAVNAGSTVDDVGNAIGIDPTGNVVTCGNIGNMGAADFDPGSGTAAITSAGGTDDFIWKLDNSGNFVFVKQIGSTVSDLCNNLALDGSGNIYLTGSFNGTTDFDPGAGTFTLSSMGTNDIFVCKLDNAGDFGWAVSMGSTTADIGNFIALDNAGNVLVTGNFGGTVDFDPDMSATTSLTASGLTDPFVLKLSPAGIFVWAKSFTGAGFDRGLGLAVDGANNVYASGLVANTTDFDPGTGTFSITGMGGNDGYVCQLDASGNFGWAFTIAGTGDDAVQSVKLAAGKIFVTGRLSNTVDFDPNVTTTFLGSAGMTDIFVASYQPFCVPSDSTLNITACTSYIFHDSTYTSSGTYHDTIPSAAGCDSIITLNLTINEPTDSTLSANACGSIVINSITYTSSGTYTQTLINASGCDSVLTLNLVIVTPDVSVTASGQTITANAVFATYEWVDCNNAFAVIPGETSQSYTATADGDYAVIVTQGGCTDTSACTNITGTGIQVQEQQPVFGLYPNPSGGELNITASGAGKLVIMDLNGKTVYTMPVIKGNNRLSPTLPSGVYAVQLNGTGTSRWVKL